MRRKKKAWEIKNFLTKPKSQRSKSNKSLWGEQKKNLNWKNEGSSIKSIAKQISSSQFSHPRAHTKHNNNKFQRAKSFCSTTRKLFMKNFFWPGRRELETFPVRPHLIAIICSLEKFQAVELGESSTNRQKIEIFANLRLVTLSFCWWNFQQEFHPPSSSPFETR